MTKTPLENWIAGKLGCRPTAAALRAYQLEKLRETLALVRVNSRVYWARLRGVAPADIKTPEDLTRLPFTCPADITSDPNGFICVSPREIDRIVTLRTSGTTGSPKRVFFTAADQELTVDFFHHGMTTLTDETDTVLICMPGDTEGSVGDLLQKGWRGSDAKVSSTDPSGTMRMPWKRSGKRGSPASSASRRRSRRSRV
jgi:phenylacetate-coenzyme A ligase PaaK-like adenylate-forming protein